jgi:long-subunit fatty acid transport protein
MYRKQGKYKIGMTVRTPTYYRIEESYTDFGKSWFDNNDHFEISNPGSTNYDVKSPYVLSAGVSVQALDWLLLAGDAEYTDWTEMEFTSDNLDLIEENRIIRNLFTATTALKGGVEVTLFDLGVKLRGGYAYIPSPYKDDPSDFDQKYFTLGAGATIDENVGLNASVAIGNWKTFRDNYYLFGLSAPSRTSESVSTSLVNITMTYRF